MAATASTPIKPMIAYCRIGERSSHTWFVLKYLLGLENVTNYDGSLDGVGQSGRRSRGTRGGASGSKGLT